MRPRDQGETGSFVFPRGRGGRGRRWIAARGLCDDPRGASFFREEKQREVEDGTETSIHSLSDALLALILVDFVAAGDPLAASSLSRVCRRWKDLLSGEAARVLKPLRLSQLTLAQSESLRQALRRRRCRGDFGFDGSASEGSEACVKALLAQAARGGLVLDGVPSASSSKTDSEFAASQTARVLLDFLPSTRKLLLSQTPGLVDSPTALALWRLLRRSASTLQQLNLTERRAASLIFANALEDSARSAVGNDATSDPSNCPCAIWRKSHRGSRTRVCEILSSPSSSSSLLLSSSSSSSLSSIPTQGQLVKSVEARVARGTLNVSSSDSSSDDKKSEDEGAGKVSWLLGRRLEESGESVAISSSGSTASVCLITLRQLQALFVASCSPLQILGAPQLRRLSVSSVVSSTDSGFACVLAPSSSSSSSSSSFSFGPQCGCACLERQHWQLLVFLRRSSSQLQHLTHRLAPYRWSEQCKCSSIRERRNATTPFPFSSEETLRRPPPPPPPPYSPYSGVPSSHFSFRGSNGEVGEEDACEATKEKALQLRRERRIGLEKALAEEREAVKRELPIVLPVLSFLSTHNAELLLSLRTPKLEVLVLLCTTKRLSWMSLLLFLASDSVHRLQRLTVLGGAGPRRLWIRTLFALKASLEETHRQDLPRQWKLTQFLLRRHARQLLPKLAVFKSQRRRNPGVANAPPSDGINETVNQASESSSLRMSRGEGRTNDFKNGGLDGLENLSLKPFFLVSLRELSGHSELLSSLVNVKAALPVLSSVSAWGCRFAILDFSVHTKASLRSLHVRRLECYCLRCMRRSSRFMQSSFAPHGSAALTSNEVGAELDETVRNSQFSTLNGVRPPGSATRKLHPKRSWRRVLFIEHFVGDAFFLGRDLALPRLISLRIDQSTACTHFLWKYLLDGDFPRLRYLFFNGRLFAHLRTRRICEDTSEKVPSQLPMSGSRQWRHCVSRSVPGTQKAEKEEGQKPLLDPASFASACVPLPSLELISASALDLGDLLQFAAYALDQQKRREFEAGVSHAGPRQPLPSLRFVNASCLGGSPVDVREVFELLRVQSLGADLAFASSQATLRALTRSKAMLAVVAELSAKGNGRSEGGDALSSRYCGLFAENAYLWPWEQQTFTFFSHAANSAVVRPESVMPQRDAANGRQRRRAREVRRRRNGAQNQIAEDHREGR